MEPERPSLSDLVQLGQGADPRQFEPRNRRVSPWRATAAAFLAVALGAVFRFPVPVLLVLAVAGAGVVWCAARWRRGAHVAATIFIAGFLTQATAIFVTPFTWWLRFAFFTVLLGSYVLLIVWQTREL